MKNYVTIGFAFFLVLYGTLLLIIPLTSPHLLIKITSDIKPLVIRGAAQRMLRIEKSLARSSIGNQGTRYNDYRQKLRALREKISRFKLTPIPWFIWREAATRYIITFFYILSGFLLVRRSRRTQIFLYSALGIECISTLVRVSYIFLIVRFHSLWLTELTSLHSQIDSQDFVLTNFWSVLPNTFYFFYFILPVFWIVAWAITIRQFTEEYYLSVKSL